MPVMAYEKVHHAFASGYECLVVWSDLLDRINVFPVADGDTGTNLRISLAPLRDLESDRASVIDQLGRCAVGNSGNIAAAFFREFVRTDGPENLAQQVGVGRALAWQAVGDPRPGTMPSVFKTLADLLEADAGVACRDIAEKLRQTVLGGLQLLPELQRAGVVDAGALAMFIFFDGFFRRLSGQDCLVPVYSLFAGRLRLNSGYQIDRQHKYCVDAVLQVEDASAHQVGDVLSGFGESVVAAKDGDRLKVHVHTPEPDRLRSQIGALVQVIDWSDEFIDDEGAFRLSVPGQNRAVHLMTDAAGSLTMELARDNGISLLDSYIIADGVSRPESLCSPEKMYALMRSGSRVTTAQASIVQRHQHYKAIRSQYERVLYLCVGSAFTGNYDTVMAWKENNDQDDRLLVLDTGTASGRLGLITLLSARYAEKNVSADEILDFARQLMDDCKEFVFIDELKYLVTGGRVSKAGGFFGDLLHMKPVISPTREGVQKVGVVCSRKGQLDFTLKKLAELNAQSGGFVLMLQYTDNKEWVTDTVRPHIKKMLPDAEIFCIPLSLTSGVHMGPGTWAVAFAPGN